MEIKGPRLWIAGALGGALAAIVLGVSPAGAVNGFTSPVVVSGEDTAEPAIDVAFDGTIYINAPAGFLSNLPGSPSFLFRSDDGGATWIDTGPGIRQNLPGGGDSEVALDPVNGKIYFTDLYLANSTLSISNDKGNTWAFANPVGGAPVHDRQWIATPGAGIAYHVYNQIPTGLWVTKSIDGGMTWILGSVAATPVDRTGCICPPGTLVAENGGGLLGTTQRVGVIYSTSTGGIGFARSTNGGITFSQSTVSPNDSADDTTEAFPVVARAGSQLLRAVWLETDGGRTRVRYASSSNFGSSWTNLRTLVDAGTSVFPWVDARGSKISVVLYHTDAEATPGSVPESAQWFAKYLESTDGGTNWTTPLPVDTQAVKSGPICTEGAGCAEDRELLDFLAVALDNASKANVTWTRSINNVDDTEVRFAKQQ